MVDFIRSELKQPGNPVGPHMPWAPVDTDIEVSSFDSGLFYPYSLRYTFTK